jgi:hypothetical protein
MHPAVAALNIGVGPCWGEACGDMLEAMARCPFAAQRGDSAHRFSQKWYHFTRPKLPGQHSRERFFGRRFEIVLEGSSRFKKRIGKKWPYLPVKENCRLALARAALAEKPWGSIRRDGLPARLGAHWEAGFLRPCASFSSSSGSTAMSILCIEWLWTQERMNPEVVIIFGTVACYRRAAVGSSHGDVHPGNWRCTRGAVRPHSGFVVSLFFISPRTGHSSSQMFEMLPVLVLCLSWARASRGV